jgi:hypothetical protein
MKIIILLLALLSIVAPAPDPECVSEWNLLWEIPDCVICDDLEPFGDYYLYNCTIIKSSSAFGDYNSVKFVSQCIYGAGIEVPSKDVYVSFMPTISSGCSGEGCTILGVPPIPPN